MTETIVQENIPPVEQKIIYPYVSLHNYTNFSIFKSLIKPAELFKRAKELGMKAIAVTDMGTCAGLWDAWKESKSDIKLIAGCTFNFVDDVANKESRLRNIVLIAKNAVGYRNLLTLSKLGYDNFIIARKNPCPLIDWNLLEAHREGLICLTGDSSGIISRLLNDKNFEEAEIQAKRLKDIFGADLALELQPNALKRILNNFNEVADQAYTNRQLKKLGEKLGIMLVAATGSLYVNKEQYQAHDTWLALGSGQPINSGNRLSFNVNDFYMKSGEEVFEFFRRTNGYKAGGTDADGIAFAKQLLLNSVILAKRCEKPEWIDPKYSNPSGKELPEFPVKDQPDYQEFLIWVNKQKNVEHLPEDAKYLRYKCIENYKTMIVANPKYKDVLDIYKKRIIEELDVFEAQGFSGYMLIVGDFLEWARKNNISVGPGRGCVKNDTLVLTENGYKKIIDINIGDRVYTHTGKLQKVLDKLEYDIDNEDCIRVQSRDSFHDLILTKDHKVFGSKSVLQKYEKNEEFKKIKTEISGFENPSWIEVNKLNSNDAIFTTFPINRKIEKCQVFDLYNFIPENHRAKITADTEYIYQKTNIYSKYSVRSISRSLKNKGINFEDIRKCKNKEIISVEKQNVISLFLEQFEITIENWQNLPKFNINKIKRFINFDDDFAYFIGRWMGDGCFHGGQRDSTGIAIAFNSNDHFGIDWFVNYFIKLGFNPIVCKSKTSNAATIAVVHKSLPNLIKYLIPNYTSSYTKHFPINFRNLSDNLIKKIIDGLFDADGTLTEGQKIIKTTSYQMVSELREALLFLKIKNKIYFHLDNKRYDVKNHDAYTCRYKDTISDQRGYYSKIINVFTEKCNKVYDISVDEDHSYLTNNYVIHNSAGGSLVAYLLNIHIADPIKYDLFFQRFHSKFKVNSPPDIDSDVSTIDRYKVERYLNEKYGSNHVAHISNYNMMTPKPYVKAIARTFMYGGDRREAVRIGAMLADLLPNEAKTVANIFENSPLLAEYSKKYKELEIYSKEFGKNPIAISTHAAGICISKRELAGLIPLRRDRDGVISLELEKERAEENGMVKMDLLGLTTLDIIDNTYTLVKKSNKKIPYENFDYESYDKDTYDLISRGDTQFIFQLGTSGGTIDLCKKYQPKSIEDLAIITTIARPAAKELREDFFKVKNGEQEVSYFHPLLERAFKKTLGFPLYDESLLLLAEDVAGWDLNEADKLRKLTKEKGKNPAKAKKWKEEFIVNAVERKGLKAEIVEGIWEEIITPYSRYSFNKSHAVLYSMISYHTAYLKAHYPIEFLVANLMQEVTSGAKIAKDNISKIKSEIRKAKINIVPPDINNSNAVYTIINESTIATGLDSLKYMGSDAIPEILAKRPFTSFEDFLTRTDASKVKAPAIQALAASGALDSFKMPRKQMFLYAADYKKKLQVWLKKKPEKRGEFSYPWPDEGEWTISEIHALEQFYIGEGLTGSKFEVYPGFFTKNHIHFNSLSNLLPAPPENISEKDLKNYKKKVNNIQGIVKDVFEFKIKKEKSKLFGQTMAKATLEDPYGNQVSVTFFPEKWQYLHERIKDRNAKLKFEIGMALSIIGNVQWFDGNISIIFDELQEAKAAPQTPPKLELKSKKTVSVRKRKDDVVDEDMDRQELLDEIEEELIENGFADLDDENEDENTWSDG